MTSTDATAAATPSALPDATSGAASDASLAQRLPTAVIGLSSLALALIAGFFYAYACSVMVGFAHTDDVTFIGAMQAINANVRNVAFGLSFFGALVLSIVALVLHLATRPTRRTTLLLGAAALLYAAAFGITMAVSVPLNDQLAAAGAPDQIADPAAVRAAYEASWVRWNLTRTIASTLAFICSGLAFRWVGRRDG